MVSKCFQETPGIAATEEDGFLRGLSGRVNPSGCWFMQDTIWHLLFVVWWLLLEQPHPVSYPVCSLKLHGTVLLFHFSAVMPPSPALCLTWYGIPSSSHLIFYSLTTTVKRNCVAYKVHTHIDTIKCQPTRSTQPCIPPGSLNQYQLRLG